MNPKVYKKKITKPKLIKIKPAVKKNVMKILESRYKPQEPIKVTDILIPKIKSLKRELSWARFNVSFITALLAFLCLSIYKNTNDLFWLFLSGLWIFNCFMNLLVTVHTIFHKEAKFVRM